MSKRTWFYTKFEPPASPVQKHFKTLDFFFGLQKDLFTEAHIFPLGSNNLVNIKKASNFTEKPIKSGDGFWGWCAR